MVGRILPSRSEHETSQNISSLKDDEQTTFEADTLDIAPLQRSCEDFKDMMLYPEQGESPVDEQKARKIVLTSEFYTLLNGKLFIFTNQLIP